MPHPAGVRNRSRGSKHPRARRPRRPSGRTRARRVAVVRILIWHGYLLGGTGSNVYTRELARAWSRTGHEVVVLCQEPHPERYDLGGATVVRPRLPGPLPVFVTGPYEDLQPQLLTEMNRADREAFVAAN